VADEFDNEGGDVARQEPRQTTMRRVLLPTIGTLAALIFGIAVFTGVWTDRLWFQSVGYSDVFSTILLTRTALFLIFGLLFAAVVVANIVIAYRTQPIVVPQPRRNDPVARYREVITPIRGRLLIALGIVLLLAAGSVGAGQWSKYLLWRNGVAFDEGDEYFNRDIGFFVFDYPWWRFLLSYGFVLLGVSIVAAALIHYLYGGIVLQGRSNRFSSAAQVHLSILLGLFMLLKAVAYWLDRFGLAIADGGLFTGISYTDAHAVIPAKNILIVIALICAVLFFANAIRRSWLLPGIGLGMLVLSSILIGGLWPAIMQSFQVKPSEPDKEAPYIENNITATRDAFGLTNVDVESYDANTDLSQSELTAAAEATPGTRLLDPTQVSPAFEQLQQVRGYYTMPATLDVDRYQINDPGSIGTGAPTTSEQDIVIAARELNLDGLEDSQRNWANDHTVYTHGYGVVAARGNAVGPEGQPVWTVRDIPPVTADESLDLNQPRIYYGENSPNYSIVGQPEGAEPVEVDIPQGTSDETATSFTYDGDGGVPIGGLFNQALYALKFGEPNILLSGRVNEESTILYDRHPRERIQKVAPWLTVDGNPYPAVVPNDDGERRVVWIVDAYTTSSSYPLSELISLEEATSTSLTEQASNEALANDQVNYMRNSVKATVDAYTGEVTLYAWDESDPVLQTWMNVFPDAVQPRSDISQELLEHLRYPEDQFKVQREMLTQYHVTDSGTFYEGGERWTVPEDPTVGGVAQPPYYLSVQMPGEEQPNFSLTSVFVPQTRENLASFMSVNADANDTGDGGYGTIEILQLPSETQVPGPSQMANEFDTDEGLAQALLQYRQSEDLQLINGNLLTLPVGDGLLYVQPIYTQRTSTTGTYPILQFVVASFGDQVGYGKDLDEALRNALGQDVDDTTTPPVDEGAPPPDDGTNEPPPADAEVAELLEQADQAYQEAQDALRAGELGIYEDKVDEMQTLIQQAMDQLNANQTETPEQQE